MNSEALVPVAGYGLAPLALFGLTYGLLRHASRLVSWATFLAVVLAVFAVASRFESGAIRAGALWALLSVPALAGAFVPLAVPSLHVKPFLFLALGWGCFMGGVWVTFMVLLAINGGGGI